MIPRHPHGGYLMRSNETALVDQFVLQPHRPFSVDYMLTDVQLPRRGVYAIWIWYEQSEHPTCLYVGSSNDIRSRLLQHRNESHNDSLAMYVNAFGDTLAYSAMSYGAVLTLHTLEQALIDRLQPACNAARAC